MITAVRLPDVEPGKFPEGFDWDVMSYWKVGTTWHLYLPGGRIQGNLSGHEVTEHEDGTITVSPSILVEGGEQRVRRHGFLKRGVWHPCSDDQPGEDS